jgi:predicted nucleic acid-binding protein
MAGRESSRLELEASSVVRIIGGSTQTCAFTETVESTELVLAPELMLTEVANTLWRLQSVDQLQVATLQERLRRAVDLVDHIEPDRTLHAEAFALATHLDHPFYVCLYLVLARRDVASLLSADHFLLDLVRNVLP